MSMVKNSASFSGGVDGDGNIGFNAIKVGDSIIKADDNIPDSELKIFELEQGENIGLVVDIDNKKIRINGYEFDIGFIKPFRPVPISPSNGELHVELYALLKISPYSHPLGIAMGGVHWQLAKDADFTDLVFESRRVSVADNVLITSNPDTSVPYLEVDTTYFWRARYFDLREFNSEWSDVWVFTTEFVARDNVIVQPDILHPVNGGAIPERGYFSSVSHPVTIGNVVPNAMDYQISITPDFASSDVIVDKQNHNNLTYIYINTAEAEFRHTPSPLFARVRHKDTVRNIESRWSPVPTLWIQRLYRDAVVGREVRIDLNTNKQLVFWIDRNGNHVAPQAEYWNDSPIWGSLVKVTYRVVTSPITVDLVCCRVPGFFTRAETVQIGAELIHRYWVSIAEFENSYIHPAFVNSPTGFLLTNLLLKYTVSGKNYIQTYNDGQNTVANAVGDPFDWYDRIKNTVGSNNIRIVPYNIHSKCAIQLLALLELGAATLNSVPMVYRGIGNINCGNNPQHSVLSHNFHVNVINGISVIFGIPSAYNPENIIQYASNIQSGAGDYKYAAYIYSGFDSRLGAHLELYNIPHDYSTNPDMWYRYYSRVNVDVPDYNLQHKGGELSVTDSIVSVNDYTFGVNARNSGVDVCARALVLD